MSAQWDKSQAVSFHYGNAFVDLDAFLPTDDFVPASVSVPNIEAQQFAELFLCIEKLEGRFAQMQKARARLSFTLSDLKRLLS